jgi:uridine kinase
MAETVPVTLNGKRLEVLPGSTVAEILARGPHPGPHPPLAAVVGTRIVGLFRKIRSAAEVRTIDRTSKEGMDVYRRTACILLYETCRRLFPGRLVEIGQSLMGGYFHEIEGLRVTARQARAIEAGMRALVAEDFPLRPKWIDVEAAIRIVRGAKLHAKAALLAHEFHEDTTIIELDGGRWHLFGTVAPSTGAIDQFAVTAFQGGIILHFPAFTGTSPKVARPQPKLFATFRETQEWNALVGCANVAQLNEHAEKGTIGRLIKVAEALHEKKISAIADTICRRRGEVRLVLIAGPSSSGKTTFSKRLEVQLQVNGVRPVTLSVDHYYKDRARAPRHADGTYDFEAPEALDLDLLGDHLRRLIAGEAVATPVYSFATGKRARQTETRRVPEDGVLLIEGIHALGDLLSRGIPRARKFKVFVSALTQLAIDEHNRIFTSDARLIRRIVRDRLYRDYTAAQTIEAWPSVRAGEERYIFPYQEDADVMFNSALVYEQAVLKPYAERYLMEVPRTAAAFIEATRLYQFLQLFIPVQAEEVPYTSVLREFIGGSTFRY